MYRMEIYVDGGCRNNGSYGAYGAAAAVFMGRSGSVLSTWTRRLHSHLIPPPTNQRAEIIAIIIAQRQAIENYSELQYDPSLYVRIHSDSRYAVECMNVWIYNWRENGWRNARGSEVVNRDLIEEADDLDTELKRLGRVEYIWVPRAENVHADRACNECMDDM